jgi:acyl carrier protein
VFTADMEAGEEIVGIIFEALASVNELLPDEKKVSPTADGALFGRPGKLDSLGLVRLLVTIEQLLEEKYSVTIIFGEDRDRWPELQPFRSVRTLANYIAVLVKEKSQS